MAAKMRLDPTRIGSSFESFLEENGIVEDVNDRATKALFAEQLQKAMRRRSLTKRNMASALGTSRSQLDRILDPANDAVTLGVLKRAAAAVGKRLRVELVDVERPLRRRRANQRG
jgi:hypothetical protein